MLYGKYKNSLCLSFWHGKLVPLQQTTLELLYSTINRCHLQAQLQIIIFILLNLVQKVNLKELVDKRHDYGGVSHKPISRHLSYHHSVFSVIKQFKVYWWYYVIDNTLLARAIWQQISSYATCSPSNMAADLAILHL